jgi:hypothetical protein
MKTIVLNGTHVVSGTYNSQYKYDFNQGGVRFKNSEIAVASISIYYSWFSITSELGNNTFSYVWYDNAGSDTYTITIPDGFYSVSDLNAYLQSEMVSNGTYLIDDVGDYVYYLEFVENSSKYAVQFNSYAIPTALPTDWSNPASITFPASASTPQIVIASNDFRDIIGFSAGTYPSSTQTTDYSYTSDYTPQVSPVQSIIMRCDLVINPYSNPQDVIYSFAPTGTTFGSLISSVPNELIWCDIQDQYFNSFNIYFVDQTFNRIKIEDSNIVVLLVIRDKKDK